MRAVGHVKSGTDGELGELRDVEVARPSPEPHDLLVRVEAVAVNPLDVKVRLREQAAADKPKVLGWDASGVVEDVGCDVTRFAVGDEVFYAGELDRPGTNSVFHAVDERIVGNKPRSLDFEDAAALPLASLTAYEMLFDRFCINPAESRARRLLILGGAGGVPSLAIQLARRLTDLTVIASASRPESDSWVRHMGANAVVDHSRPLDKQLDPDSIDYIFTTHTNAAMWQGLVRVLAPQGKVGIIDDPGPLDMFDLKRKSASVHWESMFTRSKYATPDMGRQGQILDEVAGIADNKTLVSVVTERFGPIQAKNLQRAHERLRSGSAIGKLTLAGFNA